jgi:hypothetical protein
MRSHLAEPFSRACESRGNGSAPDAISRKIAQSQFFERFFATDVTVFH